MFSGLVSGTGIIKQLTVKKRTIILVVEPINSHFLSKAQIGDSIAIDGTCLTIEDFNDQQFTVTLMPQTFKKTTFKERQVGDLVNLERSLQIGSRLEGHIVTGHIDEVTKVISRHQNENAIELVFELPKRLAGQVVSQGSIAINGVSLTVMIATKNTFSVGLIPHTQSITNLDELQVGSQVNLETDILGKYVAANLEMRGN